MGFYDKKSFDPHGESDKKNSWYWTVLVKNEGGWSKARQAVLRSRANVDPTCNLYWTNVKIKELDNE